MAEQDVAGQWGQLARCTGPGSRTVVHLTDEPSGTLMSRQWCIYMGSRDSGASAWLSRDSAILLVSGQWCIELHRPAVTASESGALNCMGLQ